MSLICSNITFSYDNFSLTADFQSGPGEFLSILGPSGSGKTTLLRILAGFIKPESGGISLSGRDLTDVPTAGRNIGMVFQDYALFPHLDVFHNIAYGLKSKRLPKSSIAERVTELLETVSLAGYEHRRIEELSGGEKQRVALARAIAPEPELLLFDEPLSALDVKLRKGLRREIRKIQRRLGFSAVYVTHDQEEAMSLSDRIAVMNNGKISQIGTPEEIYKSPADFFTADFIGIMNSVKMDGRELMFRPEACSLKPAAATSDKAETPANHCIINAELDFCEYSGGFYICEAVTENGSRITFYSSSRLKSSVPVKLAVDESELLSFSLP